MNDSRIIVENVRLRHNVPNLMMDSSYARNHNAEISVSEFHWERDESLPLGTITFEGLAEAEIVPAGH